MQELDDLIAAAVGDERDPYPHFAEHRRTEPVARAEGFDGAWVYNVYRHADALAVLRDPETFSSRVYAPAIGAVFGPSIIQMDGRAHHDHRGLIGGVFRRKALERWETELIRPTVEELVDAFAARGRAELVRELTIQYPIRIIARMLGIPSDDWERFTRLSIVMIGLTVGMDGASDASAELGEYFGELVRARRTAPRDDVISLLASAEIDGAPLPEEEILGFLRLLLPAGAETTYRLLGTLLLALLREQLWDAVRADRALIGPAIEETLRWESPVQYISREPVRDVEIAGVAIPAGSHVSLALGSANHDETVFADPERFDLRRVGPPNLAFAEGPHRCLGEHLARLETTVAMDALLDRFGDLRLDPDGGDAYVQGDAFRSPNRLPVRFSPA